MEEGEKYETSSLSSVVVPIDGSKGLIVVIGLLWRRLLCWNDARVGHKERRRGPNVQEVCGRVCNCVELPVDAGSGRGTTHVLRDLMVWSAGQRRI